VLRALGDHAASAESAREALRLQPDFPEASNNLGLALKAMGRLDEAVDAFREATARGADPFADPATTNRFIHNSLLVFTALREARVPAGSEDRA